MAIKRALVAMNVATMGRWLPAVLIGLTYLTLGVTVPAPNLQFHLGLNEASSNMGSRLFGAIDADAHMQTSAADMLLGAQATFDKMEADSEMGADLGTDMSLQASRGSSGPVAKGAADSGPATLAEYCAGPPPEEEVKLGEGTKVKANWEGYGTMYPGRIKEKNADGTVDIKYDDGFTEKNVDPDDLKVRKKQVALLQIGAAANLAGNPKNDPACKLQEFLKTLQSQLKALNQMISQWAAAQRAQIAKPPPPPPADLKSVPAAAPSSAPPAGPASSDDLEALKKQLSDRDEYITELEKQALENNQELLDSLPAAATGAHPGIMTVDDLIAQYMAQIADRDKRIEELLGLIRDQEQEFARLGSNQLSLKDIDAAVVELEKNVEEARKKRDELDKDGSLDPELRAIIDSIIKSLEKVRKKVDNLIAMEAKAKADKEKAEHEAELAAEAARKKAEEEGKDAEEAAAEAKKKAKKQADEEAKKSGLEAMKAAKDVEKDLKDAEDGANKLDTGLHPHGAKWWRYRYEHSYIESIVMIFISILMLFWSQIVFHVRNGLKRWAQPAADARKSKSERLEEQTHGTVYTLWLETFAEQMMVCLLVFLSVWLIAKTELAEVFPLIIQPADDMHVPHTADEYRHLAIDICTIFFFAIVFYFSLMFAVAHDTRCMTSSLEDVADDRSFGRRDTLSTASRSKSMSTLAGSADEFANLRQHFMNHMALEMSTSDDPVHKEIDTLLQGDFDRFPVCMYLNINVRSTVTRFFKFDWTMWLPQICLFLFFMICHRYCHMGYVRIMGFFSFLTLVITLGIWWYTRRICAESQSCQEPEATLGSKKKSIHERFNTELIALGVLQFTMFVVCYGVARMVCQPWMWELHFWPVFTLTIAALFSALLFVLLVSPLIPSFCAAMAIPPYVDGTNLKQMLRVAETVQRKTLKSVV